MKLGVLQSIVLPVQLVGKAFLSPHPVELYLAVLMSFVLIFQPASGASSYTPSAQVGIGVLQSPMLLI